MRFATGSLDELQILPMVLKNSDWPNIRDD